MSERDQDKNDAIKIALLVSSIFSLCKKKNHFYCHTEHLLAIILEDENIIKTLKKMKIDVDGIKTDVKKFINEEISKSSKTFKVPVQTQSVVRIFESAFKNSLNNSKKHPDYIYFLGSILDEKETMSYTILTTYGVDKKSIKKHYKKSIKKIKLSSEDEFLETYCVNLNKQNLDPVICRNDEIDRIIQSLMRRKKNNVVLVGGSGVGKTAIVEGLAYRINAKKVPNIIKNYTIYSLDVATLMAGTTYRGDVENRVTQLLKIFKNKEKTILFIDEIHMIVGAGGGSSSMDMSNMLKPALQKGELSCIGSTTQSEYNNIFYDDKALSRRFNKIFIKEHSVKESKKIVEKSIIPYKKYHNIDYTKEALHAAVDLTHEHFTSKYQPDKSFDVLDLAAARQRMKTDGKRKNIIDVDDIRLEISKITGIHIDDVKTGDKKKDDKKKDDKDREERKKKSKKKQIDIEKLLKRKVFGQDNAIEQLANNVYISKAGLKDSNKPIGNYLFTGPTGVGKTETAKQLGKIMKIKLHRFDMSEFQEKHMIARFIGSPPGYVGSGEKGELIKKIEDHPNSILLFDEIEKAHIDIMNLLLQVMDNGMVTGADGASVSAKNCIIIMTSNLGAREAEKQPMGFGPKDDYEDHSMDAVNKFFTPEFRNRLDSVIPFNKIDNVLITKITRKFLNELRAMLKEKEIKLKYNDAVVSWLSEKGFDASMGARPMARTINEFIKKPLAKNILFGKDVSLIKLSIKDDLIDIQQT